MFLKKLFERVIKCSLFKRTNEFFLKTNYYYIDESGNVLNNTSTFIHGCIKTDTPDLLTRALDETRAEIHDDPYFNGFLTKFKETGFHATANHPDIRALLYRKLRDLNWRAYFVIVNKQSDFFMTLKTTKKENEIFTTSLSKLVYNRLRREKDAKNYLFFETIQLSGKSLNQVLFDFFQPLLDRYNCEFQVVTKEDEMNLAIVDYLNYVLFRILESNNTDDRMRLNFEMFAPKIALIHIQNTNIYLSRSKEEITVENLLKNW